jgi:transposase
MLHLSAAVSYYHFNQPTDMRKGFDSLTGSLQQHLGMSVTNGSIFIFFNKKRNQVKLLLREGDGQSLYYKRLEAGNSELPAALVAIVRLPLSNCN